MALAMPELPPEPEPESGLTIVLTPVQMAAIFEAEHISWQETLANRLWGGVKLIGGALELRSRCLP
jgi:hypothetical protein